MIDFLIKTYTIVLPPLVGYVIYILKEQKKDRSASQRGIMFLLKAQLTEYHSKYMKKGSIPSYEFENFQEMYEAYHELGGNGMGTKMKNEIEKLPIVD